MANTPAIPFHTKVRVRTNDPAKARINGMLGYIGGVTERPMDDGRFGYGVFIYELARVWSCREAELELTGEVDEQRVRIAEQQRLRLAAKNSG